MTDNRSARGALAYLGVAGISRASGFVLLPLFASALAPSDYGQLAILLSVFGLATTLLPAGLETPLFRAMFAHDIPERQKGYVHTLVTTLFVGPIVLGGAAGLLLALGPSLFGLRPGYVGMYVFIAGLFTAATIAPLTILKARESFGSYAVLSLSYAGAQLLLRVILVVVADMGVRGWLVADLSATLFVLVLSLLWQRNFLSVRSIRRDDLRLGLAVGLPLVPHGAAHWVLNISDRLVLAAFWSPAIVGVYSVGYQIAFVAGIAVIELNRAFMPRYGEALRNPETRDALSVSARYQVVTTIALTSGVSLFGPQVVHLVLPSSYSGAAYLVPFIALGYAFLGMYCLPMNLISIVAGKTRGIWTATVCAAAVNLGANLLLVPVFGPIAAAVNTAVGYFALWSVAVALARRRCPSVRLDLQPIAYVVPMAVVVTAIGSYLSVQPGLIGLIAAIVCGSLVVGILGTVVMRWPRRASMPVGAIGELYV